MDQPTVATDHDVPTPALMAALAATLDTPVPQAAVPPLWHWALFQHWPRPAELSEDGHAREGVPAAAGAGARRMWAGGRLDFHRPLRIGAAVERRRRTASVVPKQGRSGPLVFVTLHDELHLPDGLAVTEEIDLVYRARTGPAAEPPPPPAPPVPAGALRREVRPDAVLLFRYSALTGNSHRIHYDLAFATGKEGYPGLLVHGPLQATWLAALAQQAAGGAALRHFRYRAHRPAFAGAPLLILAAPADGGVVRAETRDATGAVCMAAEAAFG